MFVLAEVRRMEKHSLAEKYCEIVIRVAIDPRHAEIPDENFSVAKQGELC